MIEMKNSTQEFLEKTEIHYNFLKNTEIHKNTEWQVWSIELMKELTISALNSKKRFVHIISQGILE